MKLNLDPKSTVQVDGKNYLSVMDNFVFTEGVLNITVLSYVWSNTKQKDLDQDIQQLEVAMEEASNHDIIFAEDITFVDENSKGFQNPIEINPKGSKNPIETQNPIDAKNTESKSLLNQRKIYTCPICLKMINKGHDLKRHLSRIHGFECKFCPLKFVLKRDMFEHAKFVHPNEYQACSPRKVVKCPRVAFKCQFCSNKFVKKEDMHDHETMLHLFKCQFCPIRFVKKEDMDVHVSFNHALSMKKGTDHHVASFLEIANKNNRVHERKNQALQCSFECRFCSSMFVKRDDMNKHITFDHEDKTLLPHSHNKCVCYHVIHSTTDLERHHDTVHERKKQFECSICLMIFNSKKERSRHSKLMHGDFVLFNCKICKCKFSSRENLTGHIERVHADYVLKKKEKMKREKSRSPKRVHDGINPVHDDLYIQKKREKVKSAKTIQCDICPAKFTRRGNLKQHISNVHEGIKPHQCLHCPAKFAFKPALKRHLIEHELTILS